MLTNKFSKFHFSKMQVFWTGLIVVLLSQIPFLLLGVNSVIPYHDQLDGELIAYIYQAKYLFSGQNMIPEFLNGAAKTALQPPAPLAVLLFRMFSPLTSYLLLQLIGQLTAYAGMFFLNDLLTGQLSINFIVALLYAFLPFLPLYGLSQYGMPLLLYCIYQLYHKRHTVLSLVYMAFYTAMSSLVLCGFIWLLLLFAISLFVLLSKKGKEKNPVIVGFFLMTGIYLIENLSLFQQFFDSKAVLSHRSEFVLSGEPFIKSLWNFFLYNGEHSEDNHIWILLFTMVVLFTGIFLYRQCKEEGKKTFRLLLADILFIILLCALSAFWESHAGTMIRTHLGSLGSFQLSRFLWLAPLCWYISLALCFKFISENKSNIKLIEYVLGIGFLGVLSVVNLKDTFVKPCLQELLIPEYDTISYSDYLALGVMEQVEEYIESVEGKTREEYRVASLGIDPAAALYHGFYCIDGYSNNYALSYKHAFREVIAPELEQNEWLKTYFDTWGNRCYLFSHEIPGYYNIQKNSFWYNDLQINTNALAKLGCNYVLSAAYVVNAEEIGMELLSETPFQTDDSYYLIYLYKIQTPDL